MERVRCFHCRRELEVEADGVVDAHGAGAVASRGEKADVGEPCLALTEQALIFLREEQLPAWVRASVEREGWTKGKLHCGGCGCKLGSFDFVTGRKCECGGHVLPPVHLVRSQVDAAHLLRPRASICMATSDALTPIVNL